jgi:hypothetical protein
MQWRDREGNELAAIAQIVELDGKQVRPGVVRVVALMRSTRGRRERPA